MVAISTLMNLKYFARKGLWQHFIWMKRSGALMFNHCLGFRKTLRYNTFSPDSMKKMPKSDLVEETWRLQAVACEQTEITEFSQQEVCFEEQINIVLLPCRHHVLCRYSNLSIPINTAKLRHHSFSCMYVYSN
ncbi:hypothetical protein E1A91_A07G134700v1 [Gossypium mustelinum]|uniref:Uncharacterized protein n=1 Tax=Gossypium mustelinum TaxID=34275 RepID=A0A5D2YJU9_GOSMU|nr:hypothetical protein E1A91_A07G134700v1 [Gossypium mustelinum]